MVSGNTLPNFKPSYTKETRSNMHVLAFDTETCLFRAGVMAPELVCVTWQYDGQDAGIMHVKDPKILPMLTSWLEGDVLLVGHHLAFDLAVLGEKFPSLIPLIFRKYDRDEFTCTKIRSQLLDIVAGQFQGHFQDYTKKDGVKSARWVKHGYTLDDLLYRAAGRRLDKDTWRLRYGEFLDVPLKDWPEGARTYPLEDAKATLEVFLKQETHVAYMEDQFRQARAAWGLHLESVWGLRTHAPGVDKLEAETVASLAEIEQGLVDAGLVRHDGSRDTQRAQAHIIEVCAREGITLRLTDGGVPSLDRDACEATGDELLEDYAALTSLKAVLNKDIPVLRAGTQFPVHTSFGLAASGRSTSRNPNVQNPRRLAGIREAFIPRPGKVFAQADFSALELHTLAQVCLTLFGKSHLAEALNAGLDPHTAFAADIIGISYEEGARRKKQGDKTFDNTRQTAKVANFGFPGGLGYEKFCLFARKSYGVKLTPDQARGLKEAFLKRWPELQEFFAYVGKLIDEETGEAVVTQLFSNRMRGGCHYTAACNTYFQGLGADAAKRANYLVARACYAETDSVLYGSRPVLFVHDEIILETDAGLTSSFLTCQRDVSLCWRGAGASLRSPRTTRKDD
jgi:DNA polymerase-1